ncbi:MAG: outer membrane beta-barrel protein [Ferruginibacter sp.]
MKKVILGLAIVAAAFSVNAQSKEAAPAKKISFGGGASIGIPVGDFGPFASLAYGADVQAEYAAAESFGVTLSAGYLSFVGKSGITISGGFIPVLLGGRYYFSPKVYGSAQAGMSFSTNSGGGSAFTFAPGVGYKVSENLDLLVKYQSATKNGSDNSFVGLRVGYKF